jgi:molecular chaperone DnaK (HSP70)
MNLLSQNWGFTMNDRLKRIFGIDLGTTYSSIAYVDEYGKAVILPNAENQRVTPSVVFFDSDNIVVGEVAKECSKLYPNEVVSFIKRSMGEPDYIFDYKGKSYRPEEISSFILRKVAQDAELALGEKVTDAVITCPAYFGINEREATRVAGEIAGFNVRQIINEPTAAAIAYGAAEPSEKKVVVVYDLGGGTFDITMIEIRIDSIEVICTGGDHNLGGKDWDDRIVTFLVQEFQRAVGTDEDILEDPDTWQDLQLSAERSKKILSQRDKTPVSITHGGERVKVVLERQKFEEITQDLLERTIAFTQEMLQDAREKGYDKFDEIILVGGATRMPQIPRQLKQEFDVHVKMFDPDEAVAKGAAIYGWKLSLNDGLVKRIADKSIKGIDPDRILELTPDLIVEEMAQEVAESVGYTIGAVKKSRVNIKDVTSKSFGVVVRNPENRELVYNLIVKNTSVPVDTSKAFFTAVSNQETVLIRIMENETKEETVSIDESMEIGTAVLQLPSGLPAEQPIEISFKLNEEGRLQITAVETKESRSVNVAVETKSVIHGKELDEAIARNQSIIIY